MPFRILCVLYGMLTLLFYRIIYWRSFTFSVGCVPEGNLILVISRGGKFNASSLKYRGKLRVYVDGGTLNIGRSVFINSSVSINVRKNVDIGENTLIGDSVKIYDHNHLIGSDYFVSDREFMEKEVIIGKNCWIGSSCIILPGVNICDNVVLGAGSIVTKDIEESGVYVSKCSGLRKIR